jgi:hypothetical protein
MSHFETADLNLAAALTVATNQPPVLNAIGNDPVRFKFQKGESLAEAIFLYHQDELQLNARKLLAVRNDLFSRIREARR